MTAAHPTFRPLLHLTVLFCFGAVLCCAQGGGLAPIETASNAFWATAQNIARPLMGVCLIIGAVMVAIGGHGGVRILGGVMIAAVFCLAASKWLGYLTF